MKIKFLSVLAVLASVFVCSSQVEAANHHNHRHHHHKKSRHCNKKSSRVSFGFGAQTVAPAVQTTTYIQQAPVVYETYTPYGYTTYTQYQPAPVPVVEYIQPVPVQRVSVFQQPATIYHARPTSSVNFGFSVRL